MCEIGHTTSYYLTQSKAFRILCAFHLMMNATSQDMLAICVALAALFLIYWKRHIYPGKLPPGPKPLPFIGNIHQLPVEGQELVFSQWAKQYGETSTCVHVQAVFAYPNAPLGDVVFARFFGTPVVILNSQEAVDDLLVKRSANYSDRPPFVALKDLCVYIAYVLE